jgi:hypothetical protein
MDSRSLIVDENEAFDPQSLLRLCLLGGVELCFMSFGNDTLVRILQCRVVLHLVKALTVFEQDFKDI